MKQSRTKAEMEQEESRISSLDLEFHNQSKWEDANVEMMDTAEIKRRVKWDGKWKDG